MEVGIGLPNAVPGTTRSQLLDWARAAENAGFSSLGTIDRIVYGNYEPLVALSAAAAVTERIRLVTSVMLGPLRVNAALVAKQFLSLDALAGGGRAVLGIGLGGREDDYAVSRVSMSQRGVWQDRALAQIRRVFNGEGGDEAKIGPRQQRLRPSLIVGGRVAASFERAARHGDGWIMGGGAPDQFSNLLDRLGEAWANAGRNDEPRKMSLAYFSLGHDAERNANNYLRNYYAFLGDEMSKVIAKSAAKDPDTVKAHVAAFESAGCDELIIFPSSNDPEQVGLLAEACGR